MNISLLKKLLPGLIPLFVFIIADEIWGTEAGLYAAVAFGTAEMISISATVKLTGLSSSISSCL